MEQRSILVRASVLELTSVERPSFERSSTRPLSLVLASSSVLIFMKFGSIVFVDTFGVVSPRLLRSGEDVFDRLTLKLHGLHGSGNKVFDE